MRKTVLLSAHGLRQRRQARSDKAPQVGTGVAAFTDAGWTAGDKASWSNHLKARANYGMNDHQRAPK